MPVLLREATLSVEMSDLLERTPINRKKQEHRSPGLHVSGVLKPVAVGLGVLKAGEKLEEEYPWRCAMGNMFEEYIFSLPPLNTSKWQPGERCKDKIYGTADGLGWVALNMRQTKAGIWTYEKRNLTYTCLDETKCTEKKVRSGEDFISYSDNWMWLYQCAAYCALYGQQIVRWVVLFYRGDWRGSGPVCKEYVVYFSEKEIDGAWKMILANRHLGIAE